MISVNDFRTGITIEYDGGIWQVMEFQHVKPGKGAAFVRTKLRNLRNQNDRFKGARLMSRGMVKRSQVNSQCGGVHKFFFFTGSGVPWESMRHI